MIQYFKTLGNWFKGLLSGSKNKNKPEQVEKQENQENLEKQEINITSCTVRYIKENEN